MPTYEFRCPKGHEFERFYKTMSTAPSEIPCPECGAVAARQLSGGGGLVFKGSGFYLTDYGKNAHRGGAPEKQGDGAQADGAKADSTKTEGAKTGGAKADGAKADGAKADGAKADGAKAEGGASKRAEKSENPKPRAESREPRAESREPSKPKPE